MRPGARRPRWDPESVADALEIVAGGLRAGLTPGAALQVATDSTEWGRDERTRITRVTAALSDGRSTSPAWREETDAGEASDAYRVVGAVWDLAIETGAPLAAAVLTVADHLREEARVAGRLNALAAGPRASQRLLTLLPVIGPVLAVLIGADPMDLYLTSPAGSVSAAIGLVLTVIGWRWSRSMVRAAAQPRRYGEVAGPRSR